MERKLYEASLGGNVTSLIELLEEDPLVLDRVITGFYETPLHIAAMRGHVDFAVKVLSTKPELASELDSHGYCPLHLASTKKNVDMVKVLLKADPDICCVTDQDGRTPLHLAAMKGRVEIMRELIQVRSHAIKVLSDRRETILHLCVKHNRLEALKFLVEYLQAVDVQPTGDHIHQEEVVVSVNSKDIDGNTILHLAVARRHMKMIKYLLDSNIGVELYATNNKGFTAMDILTVSTETRGFKDTEIEDLLRDAGVLLRASTLQLFKESSTTDHDQTRAQQLPRRKKSITRRKKLDDDHYNKWLETKLNTLMVVAILIATMAFQGGVNPPGGVWQGNEDPDILTTVSVHENIVNNCSPSPTSLKTPLPKIGMSVMAYNNPGGYAAFTTFNTIGFMASLSIIFLLMSGLCLKQRAFVKLLMCVLWLSISFMALTYFVAMESLVSEHQCYQDQLYHIWTPIKRLAIILCPISTRIRRLAIICQNQLYPISTPFRWLAIIVWFGLLALVVVGHIISFILWLLKLVLLKLGILQRKSL